MTLQCSFFSLFYSETIQTDIRILFLWLFIMRIELEITVFYSMFVLVLMLSSEPKNQNNTYI